MASIRLSVVAPDQTVVEEDVQSLVVPAHDGYLGIQSNHVATIVALRAGLLEYRSLTNQREFVAIGGGFMEVSDNNVIVLADEAHRATDIDLAEAEKAVDEARRALRGESSIMTQEQAAVELDRAMARIKAARAK